MEILRQTSGLAAQDGYFATQNAVSLGAPHGYTDSDGVERLRRVSHRARPVHRESSSVHSVLMLAHRDGRLRCRTVSQTPIYNQLRGERINADVPANAADPGDVGHTGKHRLPAGESSPTATPRGRTYPAGHAAGSERETAPAWGPQAAIPPAAHIRQPPAVVDGYLPPGPQSPATSCT